MRRTQHTTINLAVLSLLTALAGCSIGPSIIEQDIIDSGPSAAPPVDINSIPDAVPKFESRSRYGNPSSYVVRGKRYYTKQSSKDYQERGIASWYGKKFHGRRTSSGETYNMYGMTAAHKTLPLPTYARVTNLRNNRSVVLKINDRGPFHGNRLIDLSYTVAHKLGIIGSGTGLVEVRALTPGEPEPSPASPVESVATEATRLYLQVGAFGSRDNADRLQSRLQNDLDTNVRVLKGRSADQLVYRVQVGPISGVDGADSLSRRLDGLGIRDTHVVIQ
ncbi:MAG: septal ring lytic transglycosylase RlpA family lipoprotein [endosymbiont of Seepiophila jonesi]|uniref:Endolytic peptidoglycan transglycosylase RlpA n=1 Tax=endosymbiont of Lamellibrachia luymesi TaxID=2200907 RepID=A0A370E0A5_9GAMM|nr:MAG: septal ring lytic transglycosylase RlpA family lipoprotein [endosymbiont of Lamellibrachia luymesi]RDH94052.1 MAG: septal ring lytic transglycosylase RlpA family lipoprotein [endosymbiont of Seepiophila jonesi]